MLEILSTKFSNIKLKYIEKDKLMPDRGTLSVEKARSLIDYNPSYPLETGYLNYINWYLENKQITDIAEVGRLDYNLDLPADVANTMRLENLLRT
jgi:dTDP-D-glucose 4,6-dehydratase